MGDQIETEQSPFLKQIFEDFQNPDVREITNVCSAQSAKTAYMAACMAHAIVNDPGPMLWVAADRDEALKIAENRLMPLLKQCPAVAAKLPKGRLKTKSKAILFPGCPLYIVSADSPNALQSIPVRYLFLDEVRSWKPGRLEMVRKRKRSFPDTYKIIIVSTPGDANSELHRDYLLGSDSRWMFKCPKCEGEHEYGWHGKESDHGIKWTKDETTYSNGEYKMDARTASVKYQCGHCRESWRPSSTNRKMIPKAGYWKDFNDNASVSKRSYTWNALLPYWTSWDDQVKEFLNATKALKSGAWIPLRDHLTETRGEFWTAERRFHKERSAIEDRVGEYRPDEYQRISFNILKDKKKYATKKDPIIYPDGWVEVARIMGSDVQAAMGRHFYTVIRSFNKDGKSRLLHQGKYWGWNEVKAVQKEWVVSPYLTCFDAAAFTGEIAKESLAHGGKWKLMSGDKKEFFNQANNWSEEEPDRPVRSVWTKTTYDPDIGTAMGGRELVDIYLFSKPSTCDRLDMCLKGNGGSWEIHEGADDEYKKQVCAYYLHEYITASGEKKTEWKTYTADDHYADAERIVIAAASVLGIVNFFA